MENIFSLEGKVALITGASKGIGEAMARMFVQHGAKVVINSRKQEALDEVAHEIDSTGANIIGVAGQVGNYEDCQRIVAFANKHFGGIDILVNNAAANPVFGAVEDTDSRAFQKIMEVNVRAPFDLAKLCLPYMKEKKSGSIINISSIGGVSPETGLGIYSVSKSAIISLTKVFANEWGKYGIRANVICPGLIQTKFSEALWQNDKILKHMESQIPMQRMGQPNEIASLALFLAADAASYCNGAVFVADGGYLV